jgi:hypothetical protein
VTQACKKKKKKKRKRKKGKEFAELINFVMRTLPFYHLGARCLVGMCNYSQIVA